MSIETWATIAVILIIIIVLAALGGVWALWLNYQQARRQRRGSVGRLASPSQSSLPPPHRPVFPNRIERDSPPGRIVWGPDEAHLADARIKWGNPIREPSSPPISQANQEVTLCPLCRNPVNQIVDAIVTCPNCGAVYHSTHWYEYGQSQCLNCREEIT